MTALPLLVQPAARIVVECPRCGFQRELTPDAYRARSSFHACAVHPLTPMLTVAVIKAKRNRRER